MLNRDLKESIVIANVFESLDSMLYQASDARIKEFAIRYCKLAIQNLTSDNPITTNEVQKFINTLSTCGSEPQVVQLLIDHGFFH